MAFPARQVFVTGPQAGKSTFCLTRVPPVKASTHFLLFFLSEIHSGEDSCGPERRTLEWGTVIRDRK